MPKGKKTGGRDFKKGEGGRPPGARNKAPSVARLFREALAGVNEPKAVKALQTKILEANPRLLELIGAYVDGRPAQRIQVETPQPLTINITLPDGTMKTLGGPPSP